MNYVLLGIKLWIRGKVHVADLFGVMMVMMLGVNCLFLEMQVVGGAFVWWMRKVVSGKKSDKRWWGVGKKAGDV